MKAGQLDRIALFLIDVAHNPMHFICADPILITQRATRGEGGGHRKLAHADAAASQILGLCDFRCFADIECAVPEAPRREDRNADIRALAGDSQAQIIAEGKLGHVKFCRREGACEYFFERQIDEFDRAGLHPDATIVDRLRTVVAPGRDAEGSVVVHDHAIQVRGRHRATRGEVRG